MVVSSLLCPMRIGERASGRSGQIYLVGHGLQPPWAPFFVPFTESLLKSAMAYLERCSV